MQFLFISIFNSGFIFLFIIVLLRYFFCLWMCTSGSTLFPFDLEIERSTCALRKIVREATMDNRISEEEQLSSYSKSEEEVIMAVAYTPSLWGTIVNELMKDRFLGGLYQHTPLILILKILYFQF